MIDPEPLLAAFMAALALYLWREATRHPNRRD